MKYLQAICCILSLLLATHSKIIPYIFTVHPTAYFQCVKDSGYNRAILWLNNTINGPDAPFIQNILNAKSAGMTVDVIISVCRARTAE